MTGKFSFHRSRNELEQFRFVDCSLCRETVISARVRATQKDTTFDPRPTGGSEINPVYSVHFCARDSDER